MRHSPVTHSKLNKIYFLPILGVIIVYGGKMLSVERLYLRESRFKYGRLLAKFPLKFSICFNRAAVPAECCQIERNSSQDKRLTRSTEDNSRVSVHKNINCSQKSPYKTLDLLPVPLLSAFRTSMMITVKHSLLASVSSNANG